MQHTRLTSLVREQPLSLFLELNVLLYAGVFAFIIGLGWTVTTWSKDLGDLVILGFLSALFVACVWFCFSRAAAWSPQKTTQPGPVPDYVLYLGCLVWCVELTYLETRLHLLSGQWDRYLLATAVLFGFFAYRFDNRFVLSLALSSLAGWFGLSLSIWPSSETATYRKDALLYCLIVGVAAAVLRRLQLKPHFMTTYLNLSANVLFAALLSGVLEQRGFSLWSVALALACGVSAVWGVRQTQFAFVAYAAVYGYFGVTWLILRDVRVTTTFFLYFVITAVAMIALLVVVGRRFGRSA